MVLCRKCACTVGPTALACPRCGWAFPWARSRRWRPRIPDVVGLTTGKSCPRCARGTTRQRTPFWLRPLRAAALHRCSYRSCIACGWNGIAFHGRGERGRERTARG